MRELKRGKFTAKKPARSTSTSLNAPTTHSEKTIHPRKTHEGEAHTDPNVVLSLSHVRKEY